MSQKRRYEQTIDNLRLAGKRAASGNRSAVREVLGEFRDDGDAPAGPTPQHPGQGALL